MQKKTLFLLLALLALVRVEALAAITPSTPSKDASGVYLIGTAEELWGFAQGVNNGTIAATSDAVLTDSIDMENENFPLIGVYNSIKYAGTFDGDGHTIKNFKYEVSNNGTFGRAFFVHTDKATIKNFTLKGTMTINNGTNPAFIASLVGMGASTTIEDVHSAVDIVFNGGNGGNTGVRIIGGLAGRFGGTINRCRYSGTIDVSNAPNIGDRIAGIVSEGNPVTMTNCLFDGTIKTACTTATHYVAGLFAKQNATGNSAKNCLVAGNFVFADGANLSNCGIICYTNSNFTATNCYYVEPSNLSRTGVTTGATAVGTTPWADITNTLNNNAVVGETANWKIVDGKDYPIPMKYTIEAAGPYTITFDTKGGTAIAPIEAAYGAEITAPAAPTKTGYVFAGWDPEIPTTMPGKNITITAKWTYTPVDGYYLIGTQEDLFNFASYVNSGTETGKGHGNAKAKLIADIILDGTTAFPGIGKYTTYKVEEKAVVDPSYAYTGIFDGQGHSITGYVRNITTNTNQGGMFNYAKGATIKDFSLAGTMTISCANGQQYGSVIGCSEAGTTVEDVHSSVNVTITSTAAQVGGFVGRAGGTYNRCSYSGTVSTSTAYNKIGGFAGNILACTLTNSLFDGTITLSADNSAMMAAAFVASSFGDNPHKIQNCYVNGTMNISHPTDSCGIVMGYYEQALTVDHAYYTGSGRAIAGAKGILIGRATPVGSLTPQQLLTALNPTSGTNGNWEIKAGQTYPVPSKCTITEHTHTWNDNGFCYADDNAYEPANHASDGRYEVSNAGQLWWVATNINNGTLAKTTKFRLTQDIDMEGDSHGQFPGICTLGKNGNTDDWEGTAFQGFFDGNNHTISNYSRTISASITRSGLINAAYNATIRKININGTVTVTGNVAEAVMVGAVVGSAAGTSHIEDINSSVSLIVTNGMVRDFGGVAGALEDKTAKARVTMNRCRYNGTITLNDGTNNSRKAENVGGLVGELRSAVIKNCLFDGTITAASGANYSSVGGVVGKVGTTDNSEMHRILSHGTITLNGYDAATNKSGIVVGSADKTIYLYKNYHTKNNDTTSGLDYIGPHTAIKSVKNEDTGVTSDTEVDQLLGTSTDKTSSLADLYSEDFRTLLGEPNWAKVSSGYTYPMKDESHEHKYSNGFCTSGDGEYDVPNRMGKIYQIQNAGELFWFAEHFNDPDSDIPQDAEVQILRDIDMESDAYIYPGIGTINRPFKGVFNGMSHKIGRYYRDIVNAERTGLINNAEGATIEHFSIYGTVNFNLASIKSFHGTVLGMGVNEYDKDTKQLVDTMLITDVYSFVDVNCSNANMRVLGGIAGRTSGGVKRSRYSGTIKGMGDDTPSASGRQIAGIVANAREKILISDCLFEGTIKVTCQESDTMRVSGILASNEKNSGVKITIKNCLFNGCLQLNHTYVEGVDGSGVKSTQNGIIAGYWDSNLPKFVNNVYYLKTCDGMGGIDIGQWQGKNQQAGSTMATTEITPETGKTEVTKEQWNEIFKALDEYRIVTDANGVAIKDYQGNDSIYRNGNWIYEIDPSDPSTAEEIPVPGGHVCHHIDEDGNDTYDKYGYCTICGAARPLTKDEDGKYKMEVVSDLASFRDMVNDGDLTAGTILNAKLTEDIDFADYDGEFGKPIGNSNFNRYLYNFDGQGHKLLNVKIKTDDEYVGFFGFAGDETHDCEIHDFTITGTVEASYDSKNNDDKELCMGVVGKMYRGKVYNVHSELTMTNTSSTRAIIGGIIGCVETPNGKDTDGKPLKVVIDKCSYTGTCNAKAVGNMGGILGQASRYTEVKNCTFAGSLIHSYKGVNNTTNFSGVVGYNASENFQGVQNCVIAGLMKTDDGREFVDYGVAGNHKNVLCGEDAYMNSLSDKTEYAKRYSGNYAWNAYASPGLLPTNSVVYPSWLAMENIVNGELCAIMNAKDDASDDVQKGHPWGQVLGYQLDLSKVTAGSFNGAHTEGSPAQRVPLPGYKAVKTGEDEDGNDVYTKTVYKVVKDASNNYTADYYYFDDNGDTTPYPSDAASMKVKKIDYTRAAKYMIGHISFCLPFDFTSDMLAGLGEDAKAYGFGTIKDEVLTMAEITEMPIVAGTPFILWAPTGVDWKPTFDNAEGTPVVLSVKNPENGAEGIYGTFDTTPIGTGLWKLDKTGAGLVTTTASSVCYPYRVYLKLSDSNSKQYTLSWGGEETSKIEFVDAADIIPADAPRYNTMGQRVSKSAKGIVIVNGKKHVMK